MKNKKYLNKRNIVFLFRLKKKHKFKLATKITYFNHFYDFDDYSDLLSDYFFEFFDKNFYNSNVFPYIKIFISYKIRFFNFKESFKWVYWRFFSFHLKTKKAVLKDKIQKISFNLWIECRSFSLLEFFNLIKIFDFVFYFNLKFIFKRRYYHFFNSYSYNKYFVQIKNVLLKNTFFIFWLLNFILIIFFFLDKVYKKHLILNIFFYYFYNKFLFKFFFYEKIYYLFFFKKSRNYKGPWIKSKKRRWRKNYRRNIKFNFYKYKLKIYKNFKNYIIFKINTFYFKFNLLFFYLKERQKINILDKYYKSIKIWTFLLNSRQDNGYELKLVKKKISRPRFRRTKKEIENNVEPLYIKLKKKGKKRTNYQIAKDFWLNYYLRSKLLFSYKDNRNLVDFIYFYNIFNWYIYINLKYFVILKVNWRKKVKYFIFSKNLVLNIKILNNNFLKKIKKDIIILNFYISFFNLLKLRCYFISYFFFLSCLYLWVLVLFYFFELGYFFKFIDWNSILCFIKNFYIYKFDWLNFKQKEIILILYFYNKIFYKITCYFNNIIKELCLYYIFFISNINYNNNFFLKKKKSYCIYIIKKKKEKIYFKYKINLYLGLDIYISNLSIIIKNKNFLFLIKNFLFYCLNKKGFIKKHLVLYFCLIDLSFFFFDNFINNIKNLFLWENKLLFIRYYNIILVGVKKKINFSIYFFFEVITFIILFFFYKSNFYYNKMFNLQLEKLEFIYYNFYLQKKNLTMQIYFKFILNFYFNFKLNNKIKLLNHLLNLSLSGIINYFNNLILLFGIYYKNFLKKLKKLIIKISKLCYFFVLVKLKQHKKSLKLKMFHLYFNFKLYKFFLLYINKKKITNYYYKEGKI